MVDSAASISGKHKYWLAASASEGSVDGEMTKHGNKERATSRKNGWGWGGNLICLLE